MKFVKNHEQYENLKREIMRKSAFITGAGSGVGRAVALSLAKEDWRIALVGRRESKLIETAKLAGISSEDHILLPANISDFNEVSSIAKKAIARFGEIELLVNSAGTNVPKRRLCEISQADYDRIVRSNLDGTYHVISAFLPHLRARAAGTIINIVSDAALWGMPLAGAAYTISKFGQRGLTQAINAEENQNGIRACAILPGEIDTPLLKLRPNAPSPEQLASMLQAEDVAKCVMLAVNLPQRAVVQELLIRPRK